MILWIGWKRILEDQGIEGKEIGGKIHGGKG